MKHFISAALLAPVVANTAVQLVVKDALVRATEPQPPATGACMQLTASEDVRLVDARPPLPTPPVGLRVTP